MAFFCYLFRRAVAIVLGVALTGYRAWASWTHQGDLIGPLAAVSAAVLLAFCDYAWRDRQRFMGRRPRGARPGRGRHLRLDRVGACVSLARGACPQGAVSQPAEDRSPKGSRHAQQALDKASAEASDACSDGAGPSCKATSQRETVARQRVTEACSKLVGLGAETVVDPAAGMLGAHAETFRLIVLLGLPLWLELAAPVVLAYGFAPAPRKGPDVKTAAMQAALDAANGKIGKLQASLRQVRSRGKPPSASKPTAPSVQTAARPSLKLVAANQN